MLLQWRGDGRAWRGLQQAGTAHPCQQPPAQRSDIAADGQHAGWCTNLKNQKVNNVNVK